MLMRSTAVALLATIVGAGCSDDIPVTTPTELAVKQIGFGSAGSVELSWKLVLRAHHYRLHYDTDGPGAPYEGTGLRLVHWPAGCGDFDAGGTRKASANGDGSSEAGASDDAQVADAGGLDAQVMDGATADAAAEDGGVADAAASDGATVDASPKDATPPVDKGKPVDMEWTALGLDSPMEIPGVWCLEVTPGNTEAGPQPTPTPATRPRVRLSNLTPGVTYHFAVQAERNGKASDFSDDAAFLVKDAP